MFLVKNKFINRLVEFIVNTKTKMPILIALLHTIYTSVTHTVCLPRNPYTIINKIKMSNSNR